METTVEYREVLLSVHGVSLALGGQPVLRDVSFEVKDLVRPGMVTGQVVALLGPSGVGKTQLLRVLAGLQAPDVGEVRVGTKQVAATVGSMGVVAQSYPLFDHRTVRGNLEVVVQGTAKERRDRAAALLARFGLEGLAEHYPAQLSGGQRQRVAIAQQLLCSSRFLLMDEPFSGLDPMACESVSQLITEVANMDELNTVIIVTHDLAAAAAVADHLWLLGRDRDAAGALVPGARVQATFDLVERGLAWHPELAGTVEMGAFLREVREEFRRL